MAIYTRDELLSLGLSKLGENVKISKKASIYGASRISIGDNVRIDDFCVLSAGEGGITLGSHIHLAVYSCLIGTGHIQLDDFCNISSRVAIYSSSDDYSGAFLTNPTIDREFTNVEHAPVTLAKHVIVGSGSVIFPGVTLEQGVAVGALTMVNRSLAAWGIYAGQPAKYIKAREDGLLAHEKSFLAAYQTK